MEQQMVTDRIELNMPEDEYHARPELSSTQARRLLESPARYRWDRDHPEPAKAAFDLGTAVHSKVLGIGASTVVIPEDLLGAGGAMSTKAAKEFIAEARANGLTPVKQDVADQVNAMTEAVLAHPTGRALLEQPGRPEASLFATDPETGVELRARYDFLPDFTTSNPIAVDLKTTGKSASNDGFMRSVLNLGYDVQEEHYDHIHRIITGVSLPFVFLVVEVEPPHLVAAHQLDVVFREMGATKARRARDILAECQRTDVWPGYPTDVDLISPPTWAVYQHEEQYS